MSVALEICSDGWKVTGYYVPVEDDFAGAETEINLADGSAVKCNGAFLEATKVEGWGRTSEGWYLGWAGGKWQRSASAENAHGKALAVGSLAVDPNQIPLGSTVTIPTAATPWNTMQFTADDTGGAITRKHLDVFCGEGGSAKKETYRITADNLRVCFIARGV